MNLIPVEVMVPMAAATVPPSKPEVTMPTFPCRSTALPPLISTVSRWKSSKASCIVLCTRSPL